MIEQFVEDPLPGLKMGGFDECLGEAEAGIVPRSGQPGIAGDPLPLILFEPRLGFGCHVSAIGFEQVWVIEHEVVIAVADINIDAFVFGFDEPITEFDDGRFDQSARLVEIALGEEFGDSQERIGGGW